MMLQDIDLPNYWFKLMINDCIEYLIENESDIQMSDFVITDRDEPYLRPEKHMVYIYEDYPEGDKIIGYKSSTYSVVCQYNIRVQMSRRIKSINLDESFGRRLTVSMFDLLDNTNMSDKYNFDQVLGYTRPRKTGVDLDESSIYDFSLKCLYSKKLEDVVNPL